MIDGHLEVDAILIARPVNAVRTVEISDAIAGGARIRHTNARKAGTQNIARLSVEPRRGFNLAVDIAIGHVGIVRIVLIPSLVGELDVSTAVELLLDRTLDMIGLIGKGRTAGAFCGIRISAYAEGHTVSQCLDGRGV